MLQKNDGEEQSAEQEDAERQRSGERGAGVTEIGWSAERIFAAHMIGTLVIQYCVYGVVFFMYGTLGE